MTGRSSPIPPSGRGPSESSHSTSRHEKLEKVEKISEVDEDKIKRSPFRQLIDQEQEPTGLEKPTPFELFNPVTPAKEETSPTLGSAPPPTTSTPTTTESYTTEPTTSTTSSMSVESSSPTSYSAAPAAEPPPPTTTNLPESPEFWTSTDEPPDVTPSGPSFQEATYSYPKEETPSSSTSSTETEETEESEEEEIVEEVVPWMTEEQKEKFASKKVGKGEKSFLETQEEMSGKKGKPVSLEGKEEEAPFQKKEKKQVAPSEEKEAPTPSKKSKQSSGEEKGEKVLQPTQGKEESEFTTFASPPEKISEELSEEGPTAAPFSARKQMKEKTEEKPTSSREKKEETALPFLPEMQKGQQGEGQGEQRGEKEKKSSSKEVASIQPPSQTPIAPQHIPVAQAAASQAAPFLSPEVLSLYYHMVGTITAMVSPNGDSHTEFLLNSPGFANSKFFGATIAIDRFSTAPYQINIRLSGSSEAVTAFNQNLPSLMEAFKQGKFSFTVNRIEAHEKPLIRRKEREEGKEKEEK